MADSTASHSDLIAEIKTRRKEARDKREPFIKEATDCYGMVAGGGQQWSDEDKQTLKDTQRIPVEFNRCGPTVDVVVGMEVGNRQETNYLPREQGDAGADEVLTGAAKWVRDECNAEDEESEAFWDMTVCGEGWMETRLDYEYDPDGMILMERVDPLEMLPDATSVKKNYRDADYLIRERMVDLDWVKATWPDKEDELTVGQSGDEHDEVPGEPHRNVIGDQYRSSQGTSDDGEYTKKQVKLVEYQRKKRVPVYRVQDPGTGQVKQIDPEQYKLLKARLDQAQIPHKAVRQVKCEYWRAFSVGDTLLEDMLCPDPDSFTYKAMTAKRDRNKGQWYGLVRGMLDPQRWANKWLSQTMHVMNTNAKGGWFVENDAVDNVQKFEESVARSDKITFTKPGANTAGKIVAKVPPPMPPALAELMQFAIQSIRDTSGVSVELLGMADREQPASLEYQRKQAGITILATLFDALRKYRKEQGKNLLYLIQTYISDGRLVRIVGKAGEQYVPLVKSTDAKYDVIVDESPSSPNQKEKTWAVLQTLLPIVVKLGVQMPPDLLDYLPLPQSMIDGMKKPDPQRQAEQEQNKQIELRDRMADVGLKEAQAIKAKADAQSSAAKIQADMNKTQAQLQGEQASAAADADLKASQARLNDANAAKAMAEVNAAGQSGGQIANQLKVLELQLANRELDQKDKEIALKAVEGDRAHQLEMHKLDQQKELAAQQGDQQYKIATVKNGGIDGNTHQQMMGDVSSKLDDLSKALTAPKKVIRDPKTGKMTGWAYENGHAGK